MNEVFIKKFILRFSNQLILPKNKVVEPRAVVDTSTHLPSTPGKEPAGKPSAPSSRLPTALYFVVAAVIIAILIFGKFQWKPEPKLQQQSTNRDSLVIADSITASNGSTGVQDSTLAKDGHKSRDGADSVSFRE